MLKSVFLWLIFIASRQLNTTLKKKQQQKTEKAEFTKNSDCQNQAHSLQNTL